jgi:hypothetical protein
MPCPRQPKTGRSHSVGALLVNRAIARFILRFGGAESKGCAPACHDVSAITRAILPLPFSAPSAPLGLHLTRLSLCSPLFLCALCVKSLVFPLPRTKIRKPHSPSTAENGKIYSCSPAAIHGCL